LLRRFAPRNDDALISMRLRDLAARCARVLRKPLRPKKTEGAGKTGCALHPRSRVQSVHKNTHTSIQVQRRASGLPCAMALRLIARSPRRRIPLVTVTCGLTMLRIPVGLATPPQVWHQQRMPGPHVFAVRIGAARPRAGRSLTGLKPPCDHLLRARRHRVHRISTRVRDDRDPPLVWVRRAEIRH
jgi:hypothetical protein